jgi:hypothetical protein
VPAGGRSNPVGLEEQDLQQSKPDNSAWAPFGSVATWQNNLGAAIDRIQLCCGATIWIA